MMSKLRSAIIAGAALTACLLSGQPASATDAAPLWFGATHVTTDTSTTYAGWVDGNGPDRYRSFAHCKVGDPSYGVWRWAGDRRGSSSYCPSGIKDGPGQRGFILEAV
ncbi:hypothetical protein GA0074692_2561 [Micromonospora pallida]|uniref:Uncharacterized protein n=1 Tax=Micromonospora pallida TaxID=145854 RepID=A0A1C6SGF4_9ACTN|nr:hypothetical protein [Micromonospora pallida]SCL28551.1 hypothetical protein GA0074692_2561 [Micromonospora pallida]